MVRTECIPSFSLPTLFLLFVTAFFFFQHFLQTPVTTFLLSFLLVLSLHPSIDKTTTIAAYDGDMELDAYPCCWCVLVADSHHTTRLHSSVLVRCVLRSRILMLFWIYRRCIRVSTDISKVRCRFPEDTVVFCSTASSRMSQTLSSSGTRRTLAKNAGSLSSA